MSPNLPMLFMGEEYGETDRDSPHRWIIDPIDGTRSFIHGVPLYGVLIGLEILVIPHNMSFVLAGLLMIPLVLLSRFISVSSTVRFPLI